ncbi:MAG: very short patch repair endonuclease [Candidatus Thiodiazotropha taylori]|nr:very short patch repair endonuclease [Candidatus Thiodiazotropha taylori]
MDVLTPEQRSHCMSRIQGKNTKPELTLRKALWAAGHRYRLKNRLPGRPDIVFPSKKVAIFIDGCFWHKCPEHFQAPASNSKFWADKINRNVERDREVEQLLIDRGWQILRFWEHEVRDSPEACISKVQRIFSDIRSI